jgi:hypothetical protein
VRTNVSQQKERLSSVGFISVTKVRPQRLLTKASRRNAREGRALTTYSISIAITLLKAATLLERQRVLSAYERIG